MASPFRVFRKHQKVLIATLGLLAMIAFVFLSGPVLDSLMSGSNRNPVVVETSEYGNLRESELDALRRRRQKVLQFLGRIQQTVLQADGTAQQARAVENAIGPASEQAVVDTWLYAQHAEHLGLVVSNHAVNQFIRTLTEDRVTSHELKTILKNIGVRQRQFFELMRHELLALQLRMMFNVSLAGTTPAQRWDYFTRLKRQATVEVLPVKVTDFLGKVPDPDEKTLRTFFEKYKDNYPNPDSPEPGFHQPHKIAVRYFKADPEKFIGPDVITDEEVKKYYEEHKELFDQMAPSEDEEPEAVEESEAEKLEAEEDSKAEKPDTEQEELTPKPSQAGNDKKKDDKPKDPLAGRVGEMVRRQLAYQKVDEVLGRLQEKVNRYRNLYIRYEVDRIKDKQAKPPKKLDFKAMAKQNHLTTGKTPLISQLDAQDFEIGSSYVDARIPFALYAFEDNWPLHLTATSVDLQGNRYLFWKVKDVKERIPKFEDRGVRRRVLRSWKTVQGRSFAMKEAQRLADQVRKAKKSLSEAFADRPGIRVVQSPPFSWLTRGAVPAISSPGTPPRLSQVEGVDRPGPDFMRKVFSLGKGQIGVAMNQPQTVAYVVEVTEVNPSDKVLWAQFKVDAYNTYSTVANEDKMQTARAWQNELKSAAGLHWQRKPGRWRGE